MAEPLSPAFKIVLAIVIGFTTLSFITSAVLAFAPETDATKAVLETTLTTFKGGFGALLGLIGGKSL